MQGFSGGSKLGAFSASRLHSCAYIDEYFGSSRAFSKTCKNESVMHHVHVRPIIRFALTYQKNNSFEDNRRVQSNVQYVHRQFLKLLRRDLVEDPTDPSEHQIIVLSIFILLVVLAGWGWGGLFPSNSFGWCNPSSSCSGTGQLRCSTAQGSSHVLGS